LKTFQEYNEEADPRGPKSDSGNFKHLYQVNQSIWGTRLSHTRFEVTVIQLVGAISNTPWAVRPRSSDPEREEADGDRHFRAGMMSHSRDEGEDDENGSDGIEEPNNEPASSKKKIRNRIAAKKKKAARKIWQSS
jgi:hypothetical protein